MKYLGALAGVIIFFTAIWLVGKIFDGRVDKKVAIDSTPKSSRDNEELLGLLRKQESRAQQRKKEADNIRRFSMYSFGAAFIVVLLTLIGLGPGYGPNSPTPSGTGTMFLIAGGFVVLGIILSLIAKTYER